MALPGKCVRGNLEHRLTGRPGAWPAAKGQCAGGIGLPLGTPKQLTARNACTNCTPERRGREAWVACDQLMTLLEWLASGMLKHSQTRSEGATDYFPP